jgi:MFS family permease
MASRKLPSASLWRHRDFLLLWGGQTVSDVGSAVTVMAIPLIAVIVFKATAMQTGLLTAAGGLAFAVLSLPAGAVVDRLPKRPVMVTCDVARLALIIALPLLWHFKLLAMSELYFVAFASSALTVVFGIAYQAYLTHVIDRQQLIDGNSKLQTTWYLAYFGGSSLGSVLVATFGAAQAMIVDALSFAASAAALVAIRSREPHMPTPAGTAPKRSLGKSVVDGLSFVAKHRILRRIAAANAMSNLGMAIANAVGTIYVVRTLHVPPSWVGALFGISIAGGAVGSAAAATLATRFGLTRMLWMPLASFGWISLLIPLATPGWGVILYVVGWFGNAVVVAIYNAGQVTYRQLVCPPELLGRANASIRWVVMGMTPLGGVIGGAFATWLGIRAAIWVAFAATPIAGLLLASSSRLRRLGDGACVCQT